MHMDLGDDETTLSLAQMPGKSSLPDKKPVTSAFVSRFSTEAVRGQFHSGAAGGCEEDEEGKTSAWTKRLVQKSGEKQEHIINGKHDQSVMVCAMSPVISNPLAPKQILDGGVALKFKRTTIRPFPKTSAELAADKALLEAKKPLPTKVKCTWEKPLILWLEFEHPVHITKVMIRTAHACCVQMEASVSEPPSPPSKSIPELKLDLQRGQEAKKSNKPKPHEERSGEETACMYPLALTFNRSKASTLSNFSPYAYPPACKRKWLKVSLHAMVPNTEFAVESTNSVDLTVLSCFGIV